jgi:hypothetical protein
MLSIAVPPSSSEVKLREKRLRLNALILISDSCFSAAAMGAFTQSKLIWQEGEQSFFWVNKLVWEDGASSRETELIKLIF